MKRLAKRNIIVTTLILVFAIMFINSGHRYKAPSDMSLVNGGKLTTINPVTGKSLEVNVSPFLLDRDLVTVSQFEEFVKATGHITEAEKFGSGGVFSFETHEWLLVDGADFRYPFGKSNAKAKPDHPVTQVSWNDAVAYANWKGKRLPTQWEWEHAAKNGEARSQQYTWGPDLVVNGKYKANTWQGSFPYYNSVEDGYEATSPVRAFGANRLGLTDMGGNVWQWCSDCIEPSGRDAQIDPAMRKVLRGGSFLCDPLVCHGFQVTGRSSSTPESSMVHIGFRCAKDI